MQAFCLLLLNLNEVVYVDCAVSKLPAHSVCAGNRREFLWQMGAGFTGLALTALLDQDGFFGASARAASSSGPKLTPSPMAPRAAHVPLRAKSCIFLFMYGGPSQIDLFDYKPELNKRHGQTAELEQRRRAVSAGKLLGSKRHFQQYGQSGQWCSDVLPHLAKHMDKLAVI